MYITITAVAEGDPNPTTQRDPLRMRNGDFQIRGTVPPLGDGIDEFTRWKFDFGDHPNIQNFDTSVPLESAELYLILERGNGHFFTDSVRIEGLPTIPITEDKFRWVPIGEPVTVQFNLLDHYSSDDILNSITGADMLGMEYDEDAIISYAKIRLVQPERRVMHVAGLKSEVNPNTTITGNWQATVKVFVSDSENRPVKGAGVKGEWMGLPHSVSLGTTDWQGVSRFISPWIPGKYGYVTFTVLGVEHDIHTYDPGSNVDLDPKEPGTNIRVYRI